jgi:lipocalin
MDGYIEVNNICYQGSFNGTVDSILGKAYPNEGNNAKLKVFFTPVELIGGNYWVIALDPDY